MIYRVFVLDDAGAPRVATTIEAADEDSALRQARELCGPHARVELWVGPIRVAEAACRPKA